MRNAYLRILFGSLLVFVVGTGVHAQTPPSEDQVFRLRVASGVAGAMVLNWTIAPGNYLYRYKIVATTSTGSAIEVTTDRGEIENDPSFGRTEIYRNQAQPVLPPNLLPQNRHVSAPFP